MIRNPLKNRVDATLVVYERCWFLHGFQKSSGNLRMRKTDLYLLEYIQTEMSQSQIMPQMIQYTVFYDALGHKEAVHEEKHFADYLLSYLYASQRMAGLSGLDL